MPSICDYEGSRYSTEFWTPERRFEDLADRYALRALLPPAGETLIEVGAGFGRLADLYQEYHQVVLFDYARSMIEEARKAALRYYEYARGNKEGVETGLL